MIEIDRVIAEVEPKLAHLREECDRLDANHPAQAVNVYQEIQALTKQLEVLKTFKKLMESRS